MTDKKDYSRVGTPVGEHYNSQNELAVIVKRAPDAPICPNELLLCIVDNEQSWSYAPMLLDKGTVDWLVAMFKEHGNETPNPDQGS